MGRDFMLLQLVRKHTGCVSYIIGSKSDKNCIIVDPLMDVERYQWALDERGFLSDPNTIITIVTSYQSDQQGKETDLDLGC